jgi:hypothetical protein
VALSYQNQFDELLLEARQEHNLGAPALALALALRRCIIGWKRDAGIPYLGRVGRKRLMELAGIRDSRDYQRYLNVLVASGVCSVVVKGAPGRPNEENPNDPHRSLFRLNVQATTKDAAAEAEYLASLGVEKAGSTPPFPASEKRGSVRPFDDAARGRVKGGSVRKQKVGTARPRKGYEKGLDLGGGTAKATPDSTKSIAAAPPTPLTDESRRAIFEAYRSAGGNLDWGKNRDILAGQIARGVKAGKSSELLVAAAKRIGRERGNIAHLLIVATAIESQGGVCGNAGHALSALTIPQLAACGQPPCKACGEWIEHKALAAVGAA